MSVYEIELIRYEEVAEGTMAFYFKKPEGFSFKAGQFADFTLINPKETDEEGNTRAFSLANPPHSDEIMITTRMRDSAFKRSLKLLPLGSIVQMNAPHGGFTLHNNSDIPAVFLIGGIGITPIRSMLLQALNDKLPHSLTLFYSNRRPEDAAFVDEMSVLESENPNYTFVGTMTDMRNSKQNWEGESGYINGDLIKEYIHDIDKPIYYMAGPANMVTAMRNTLNDLGVNDDNIRTEEFSGY